MRTNVGGGWMCASGSHAAGINVDLVDKKERKRSSEEVTSDLEEEFLVYQMQKKSWNNYTN